MRKKSILYTFGYYVMRIFPIKRNKIVISSYGGKGYGDNGKYIVKELLNRHKDKYDIVWLCNNTNDEMPASVRKVKFKSVKALYEQVTAKVWIDNKRKGAFVRKRKGQKYIMTWHGGIGPKKVEMEAQEQLPAEYVRAAKNDSKMADLFIAESEWTYNLYRRAFWYSGEIAKIGVPRQDILFEKNFELINEVRNKLGVTSNKKIFLYAPTFRENLSVDNLSIYELDWKLILDSLKTKFGGEWIGAVRLHPNVSALSRYLNLPECVLDFSQYSDMQELMCAVDALATDYSSVIYEFALTNKPAYVFAKDIEEYKQQRNIALPFEIIPFSISESSSELSRAIQLFNEEEYKHSLYKFFTEYCGYYEGGKASKQVCDIIERWIKESES